MHEATSAADATDATSATPRSSLRFVAVRSAADPALALRFHPLMTVVTGFPGRVAQLVADALRLARDGHVVGVAELDGALVPLRRVPLPLATASLPIVGITELQAALSRLTGAARDRLDEEIDAVGEIVATVGARCVEAGSRLEVVESAIRRLEHEVAELAARHDAEAAEPDVSLPDPEPLAALLADAEAAALLPKIVDPEAEELAAAWEALEAATAIRRAHADLATELRAAEDDVRRARDRLIRLRTAARQPEPAELAEAVRLRQAWTTARVRAAGRFAGVRRQAAADRARTTYEQHLRRFGVSSVTELAALGTGRGAGDDDAELRDATAALADAERRCEELRWLLRAPDDEREATRIVMRARARRILGRDPGRDLAGELRAHRIDPPEHVQAQVALAAALRGLRVRVESSLEEAARAWIETQHALRAAEEERRAARRQLDTDLAHRRAELAAARRERTEAARDLERLTAELEDLHFERRHLESKRLEHDPVHLEVDFHEIAPTQIPHLLHVAAGLEHAGTGMPRRPVVIDDPFPHLPPRTHNHLLAGLRALARQVQVVVVTDDGAAIDWARRVGDDFALVWSPGALDRERTSRHPST